MGAVEATTSVGPVETLEEFDVACGMRSNEEACEMQPFPVDPAEHGSWLCSWVTTRVYEDDACAPVEETQTCRGVEIEGAGCGAVTDLPGCEMIFEDAPFFRVSPNDDNHTEVIFGDDCGAPPGGFTPCSVEYDPPSVCTCFCG